MLQRVLNRAKTSGRLDDTEDIFRKRYGAFVEDNAGILQFFGDKVIDVRSR
jgi:adenylate kinase family enzyme